MKKTIIICLLALGTISCGIQKKIGDSSPKQTIQFNQEETDSIEYEIIIIDPGFESWFITNRKPIWYYEQSFLETWNRNYVSAWNEKALSRRFQERYPDNPFEEHIEYRSSIDYGLDLNYKLYHYFKYIEETWGKFL